MEKSHKVVLSKELFYDIIPYLLNEEVMALRLLCSMMKDLHIGYQCRVVNKLVQVPLKPNVELYMQFKALLLNPDIGKKVRTRHLNRLVELRQICS